MCVHACVCGCSYISQNEKQLRVISIHVAVIPQEIPLGIKMFLKIGIIGIVIERPTEREVETEFCARVCFSICRCGVCVRERKGGFEKSRNVYTNDDTTGMSLDALISNQIPFYNFSH